MMLPAKAQGPTDYSVHANIVYRFTKYIDWTPAKKTGDFVIGVVGESPLIDKLKQITSNKKVGEQKIVVKAV
ncbi:MAG TPA: YfiR family protein, partial [Chitinophagales bacterium]|nr:YfiR family protein [Chitinophagales bacterium]